MCANWSKPLLFDPLPKAAASLSPRFLEKCIVKKLWGKTVCMAVMAILQWVILGNSDPADYGGRLLVDQPVNAKDQERDSWKGVCMSSQSFPISCSDTSYFSLLVQERDMY